MVNDPDRRALAAQQVTDAFGSPALYPIVFHNLAYASPGEITWAMSANAASLRAAASMPPDRVIGPDTPVNPFWYHGYLDAE
jgi:hypothetical protein